MLYCCISLEYLTDLQGHDVDDPGLFWDFYGSSVCGKKTWCFGVGCFFLVLFQNVCMYMYGEGAEFTEGRASKKKGKGEKPTVWQMVFNYFYVCLNRAKR